VTSSEGPDAALLARIARRDDAALGELFDRYNGTVIALGTRILRDASEAEEVAQEIFLAVWRNPDAYVASRGSVKTWLLLMARSRALDRLRALKRRGRDRSIPVHEVELPFTDDIDATGERRTLVDRALAGLPAEQREALELAYFDGYTQSEIAQKTGAPLGTVKTRLRLAMMKLRQHMEA
jgi:RNA polymerase sigma-70 factor, ECF subfamily